MAVQPDLWLPITFQVTVQQSKPMSDSTVRHTVDLWVGVLLPYTQPGRHWHRQACYDRLLGRSSVDCQGAHDHSGH